MLKNPDIQPGAAVNRWIVVIKLFQFELVHVPGSLHTGPDGLSHHAASPNYLIDEDEDADDWLDRTMSFAIILMNSQPSWSSRLNSSYHPVDLEKKLKKGFGDGVNYLNGLWDMILCIYQSMYITGPPFGG